MNAPQKKRKRPAGDRAFHSKANEFPVEDYARPAWERQGFSCRSRVCFDCEFFAGVRVNARMRYFCRLTGEKLCPETPACRYFPGVKGAEAVPPCRDFSQRQGGDI